MTLKCGDRVAPDLDRVMEHAPDLGCYGCPAMGYLICLPADRLLERGDLTCAPEWCPLRGGGELTIRGVGVEE